MPQSMLALLAVVLVTLFSFGQHRLRTKAQQDMVRDELAMVAEGVVLERLTQLVTVPFAALPAESAKEVTFTRTTGDGAGAMAFEVEGASRGVKLELNEWKPDPAPDPGYLEVTVFVRGPTGGSDEAVRLPETVVGGNVRGTIHLKRIFRKGA